MTSFQPTPADKFTFGLWTVGNRGRDPFGEFVRPALDPVTSVQRLGELGAWGVNFHDNDLVPIDASPAERDRIVRDFKQALDDARHDRADGDDEPVHRPGLQGRRVHVARRRASARMRSRRRCARWTSAWSWARGPTCSGAAARAPKSTRRRTPSRRSSDSATRSTSCASTRAIRATTCGSRSRPSRTSRAATSTSRRPAAYLAFIETLAHPEMVGVNPEVAHEHMIGLNFYHVVAQALEAGKLFHIDLNDQKPGRFDQDLRFGVGIDQAAVLPREAARGVGLRRPAPLRRARLPHRGRRRRLGLRARLHADVPDSQGEGAADSAEDREIQALLAEIRGDDRGIGARGARCRPSEPYTRDAARRLKDQPFDREALAARPLPYERLDQLVVDLLLGTR